MEKEEKAFSFIINGWFCLVLLVLPSFLENGYLNVTKAKTDCFLFGSLLLLIFSIPILSFSRNFPHISPSISNIAFGTLALLSIVSSLISDNFQKSFFGYDGWGIGSFSFLILFFFFLLIQSANSFNFLHFTKIGISILLVIGIIHSSGIDLFSLHGNILKKQFYDYVSTFGNNNWLAGFLCLLFPIALGDFLNSTGIKFASASFFFSLVSLSAILCGSDGVFLGLGFMIVFALPIVCSNRNMLIRSMISVLIFLTEIGVCGWLPCFEEKFEKAGGYIEKISDSPLVISTIAFLSIFLLFVIIEKEKNLNLLRKVICGFGTIAWLVVVAYLASDVVIKMGDSWGTYRGLIWRTGIESFSDFSLIQKLIGVGPGMLRNVFSGVKVGGKTVLAAHSEVLQELLTQGILGLSCWIVFWIGLFAKFIKNRKSPGENIFFFLSCSAYLGQSLVQSPNIMTFSIAITFAGIYLSRDISQKKLAVDKNEIAVKN